MKKLLVSVLVILVCSVCCTAMAEMYLYWKIAENPGVSLDGLSAHIVANLDGGMTGLPTYDAADLINPLQSSPTATDAQYFEMVARVGAYENASFFVELFNDEGGVYQSEWMEYSVLLNAGCISSMSGMVTPAKTWEFNNFRVVPEPTSGLLLLIGVAGLALRRRKMKKA